ncbi:MAG: excinuclease ABC subunit UvrA, partial [Deltaproteobacteria bacterium]|nr:excinuclease ABC subunit UvrA [Deltaproteobacteria bacterium]
MGLNQIVVRGAKEHNLKNVSLSLPRNQLIVITGVSGSGKSSLAFDTIYAEGQRRYVESLSAYARQFLEQMDKPDVESIEGLSPAISIEQKTASRNPRSTVGTVTEIYDYLRLLFARIGQPFCYQCGREIKAQSVQEIVDQILALEAGTRLQVLSPVVIGRKGEFAKLFERLIREGFLRVKVDGHLHDLAQVPALNKKQKHDIEVVVDRLVLKDEIRSRLAESLEMALELAQGLVKVELVDQGRELLFSSKRACLQCGLSYPELNPQTFSFNSPQGACPTCSGLGVSRSFDPERVVPDHRLSIREGALRPWRDRKTVQFLQNLESLAEHLGIDLDTPWAELPARARTKILYGTGQEVVRFNFERNGRRRYFEAPFEGVITNLERRDRENPTAAYVREEMEKYMAIRPCPDCQGSRLRPEARSVKVGDLAIQEVTAMSVAQALDWFKGLELSDHQLTIARRVLKEIEERLGFLVNVGLD